MSHTLGGRVLNCEEKLMPCSGFVFLGFFFLFFSLARSGSTPVLMCSIRTNLTKENKSAERSER